MPPLAWRMLRQYAPLWHVPTGGPWLFGSRAYVAARPRPVLADPDVSGLALQTLVRRYLAGFGPASIADMAQFAMVQRSRAKAAVQALGGSLGQLEGPDGTVLYDVPGALLPDGDTPAPPRLMAMWDSILLAYADRAPADAARLPQDRDPDERRRAAHLAGRRVRGGRVASGAGRDRGDRVPSAA